MASNKTVKKSDAKNASGFLRLIRLKKRAQFLRLNTGARVHSKSFVLQASPNDADDNAMRVGFTCTKKVGNAVARNRAKRRLRALAQAILPHNGRHGTDYVLIGRAQVTAQTPMPQMEEELKTALKTIGRQI